MLSASEIPAAIDEFQHQIYAGDRQQAEQHFAGDLDCGDTTFVARAGEALAGFITIRWQSDYEPFRRERIPFIHHLEVQPEFKRRGIATALMDAAEALIATRSRRVCICVGLFPAYAPAQRLYVKRGYVPDGRGVCNGHRPIQEGEKMGHHLLLWLIKELDAQQSPPAYTEGHADAPSGSAEA